MQKLQQKIHIKDSLYLLDNKVVSAPQIREPITGGQGNISGNFSANAANDLAVLLRSGSPAPIRVLEERTVGPSLIRFYRSWKKKH